MSTDNASWRGPNTEAGEKSAYNSVQVGVGRRNQHREIGFPISTDNASWRGPNTEADEKSAYNNVQVGGAPTQKLAESQLTIMCKLGWDNDKVILFL
ncbi:hypothetical protein V278_02285 [Staphylococcus aureus H41070]|nr:hypothetical protein V278_02285 [Staphylococcus aureus H41070]